LCSTPFACCGLVGGATFQKGELAEKGEGGHVSLQSTRSHHGQENPFGKMEMSDIRAKTRRTAPSTAARRLHHSTAGHSRQHHPCDGNDPNRGRERSKPWADRVAVPHTRGGQSHPANATTRAHCRVRNLRDPACG
jgi:hypothetical protein